LHGSTKKLLIYRSSLITKNHPKHLLPLTCGKGALREYAQLGIQS